MNFTDIFIRRPVLATVLSLLILVLGVRSLGLLPIRQFPFTQNAVITVTTAYTGADPELIAGFITTPLEFSIAQANGIDYMTSSSTQGLSTIQANLRLNYDPEKALTEINTKVNAVLNQLPKSAQVPTITVAIGDVLDAMYIGFYSDILPRNKITDYINRIVQPKLQAIKDVQYAEIIGERQFALRAWLDPVRMAAFGVTAADVTKALSTKNFIAAAGRTDGQMVTVNLSVETGLQSVDEFKNMVLTSQNGAIVRLSDVSTVSLGAQQYDSNVRFDGRDAVYVGIQTAPNANILTVVDDVRRVFPQIQNQLPEGLSGQIVYDSTKFVNSSIHEVEKSLFEAMAIVTLVVFLFLGTMRSVFIPVVTIPLSLIGTFFLMLLFGFSVNILTLLAFVLGIGLVVDDAIIVVENVHRHMEEGKTALEASFLGARELANPIIAISIVLIAVYLPIGFMGGLTGALFTEFAFTLAGAVAISAIIALTLSPMMCSKLLRNSNHSVLTTFIDKQFDKLQSAYRKTLHETLNFLPVVGVFAALIFTSIYFLYITSKSEMAPREDQGIIISMLTASPNASLKQTSLYSHENYKIFKEFPETDHIFQFEGRGGLNLGFAGMVLKPWDERNRTTDQIQPIIQQKLSDITGGIVAAFQRSPLPGAGRGLPIQFVIETTHPYDRLNNVAHNLKELAFKTGMFAYIDSDLKIDKAQTTVSIDRDKSSLLGIDMQSIGSVLQAALSEGYVNYFYLDGRSYQVIPQIKHDERLSEEQLLYYYVRTQNGSLIPLSTIASLKTKVVPESINHFQQLNAATLSGVVFPWITLGQALDALKTIAKEHLPSGYSIDYGGESRQYEQEGNALLLTFFFAIIIIFLSLAALFESFRDPVIVLISVPMSICGAMIFISLGVGGASLNIYTQVGLVTLIGLISKHGILIVQFANDLQQEGKKKREAIEMAANIRLRPILMTTGAMVLGVIPLITASGAGAVSRYNIGLVIASGISIGTLFTLFVVPAMYMFLADEVKKEVEFNS
jgi:multidrug efflux pump